MHRNIGIDDDLPAEAMAAAGLATKRATAQEALRHLVRRREGLDALSDMASLDWEGGLTAMREGRARTHTGDRRRQLGVDRQLHDDRDFDLIADHSRSYPDPMGPTIMLGEEY